MSDDIEKRVKQLEVKLSSLNGYLFNAEGKSDFCYLFKRVDELERKIIRLELSNNNSNY